MYVVDVVFVVNDATETCRAILQLPINILLDCIKLVFFIYSICV